MNTALGMLGFGCITIFAAVYALIYFTQRVHVAAFFIASKSVIAFTAFYWWCFLMYLVFAALIKYVGI